MRLSKHRRKTTSGMNMTPMIDIVFLLLIFFMTVSQISESDKEQIPLPKQKGSVEQKQATLTVNVNKEGVVIVSRKPITVPQLVALVGDALAAVENDPGRLTVVLRIDRRAVCREPNKIVKALQEMGLTQIRLAVESSNG